jgi:hypothetical protein
MRSRLALASVMIFAYAGSPAWAKSEPIKWSLVDARLVQMDDISGEPGAPHICADEKCTVRLDGSWRVKYLVGRTLVGSRISGSFQEDIASARPKANLRFFLVVSNDHGNCQIAWRGLYQFGLCLDREHVDRFGLSDAAVRFPCRR